MEGAIAVGNSIKFFILSLFILSCSPNKTSTNQALEVRQDGDVHYEGIDENGNFVEHKTFEDPLAKQYKPGVVTPTTVQSKETIVNNGPVPNRVNIVLVGDGYTKNELIQYKEDTQKIIDHFFSEEPLRSYKSFFNIHRIDVVSNESGVSNDLTKNNRRSTALGMNYWCSGVERLLCVNIQKAKQYAANAPGVDQILAIANSTKHGGAGYWSDGVGTLAARNPNSIETAIHEFGHTFGKLGDEYDYEGSSSAECLKKANGSTIDAVRMLQDKLKWYRWLDLPHINTFKGTCYTSQGYRPTANSKMRTLGMPFYEVNAEQLIFSVYRKVKPIDSATSAGIYSDDVVLNIKTVKPVGHFLEIKWFVNGKEVVEAQGKEFLETKSLKLAKGKHTVSVTVSDTTTRVRDETLRKSLMTESRSWTINSNGVEVKPPEPPKPEVPVNTPPVTQTDYAETTSGVLVSVRVTSNDYDPDGVFLVDVDQPQGGVAYRSGQNVVYNPRSNFKGIDKVVYTVKDGYGAKSTGELIVTVK